MGSRIGTRRSPSGSKHRRIAGQRVCRVARESAGGDHSGCRHNGSAAAWQAGRALLSRLLRSLLLPAVVCLLRGTCAVRTASAVQQRCFGGKPGRDRKHRGSDSRSLAKGENHLARRLRILPQRADELVRRQARRLCVRARAQSAATKDYRAADAGSDRGMEPDRQAGASVHRVPSIRPGKRRSAAGTGSAAW